MDKIIKVSEETHKSLKMASACAGLSLKHYLHKLSDEHIDGVSFNVDAYRTDILIAVFGDIVIEMSNRYDSMTEDQKKDYIREVENIPFSK